MERQLSRVARSDDFAWHAGSSLGFHPELYDCCLHHYTVHQQQRNTPLQLREMVLELFTGGMTLTSLAFRDAMDRSP